MTSESFTTQHVDSISAHPFAATIERFEAATGYLDGATFAKEASASVDAKDFAKRIHAYESTSGFMRFQLFDHGGWLGLYGIHAKCRLYILGNPLIAETMLRHDIRAGLNVPVRLIIYETKAGEVRLGYDLPSSLMSQLHNAGVTAAAEKLDTKLAALVQHVTKL
ncbi:hypothetical protein CWB41_13315 [Methylovirgula ligni]|uniref:Uncharacterized protein DUF302 n=1 Tax=Methylovirgula ligni TaxID=569860 RepID=A0A3D9YT91_9HYPH|nr:DUF302 domain-containing protein [Methylovirgula ligni]QAY96588.1 hypothetical protein CWB41_13315 [Methylovirgula ligni]REF84102.1 uncharacterized protein DUF302 [Methylovirgula ligni]